MAYDGIITSKITKELNEVIIGGKINKIYEPNNNEILIGLYSRGKNYCLNISIASDNYRAHLTTKNKSNPLNAPGFCMLLRKHLIGGKIRKIYTEGLERIIFIDLECYNELNDLVNKKLIIELMGKHSNVILTNEKNIIIDSLRHLSTDENSTRDILPAREYQLPENNKINLLKIKSLNDFKTAISDIEDFENGIPQEFTGISKLYIQNALHALKISNDITEENIKKIYEYISNTINNLDNDKTFLKTYKNDYTIQFDIDNQTEKNEIDAENEYILDDSEISLDSNFFIDDYYYTKENNQVFTSYRNNVLKLVSATLTKIQKKLINIDKKIKECDNMEYYKICGELLTANLYKFKEFTDSTIELENYYDNNSLLKITVDKNKTPSYNAKQYFKKYNKLKNTLAVVDIQKKETIEELNYLESIVYEIDTCRTLSDIDEIYTEINENPLFERTRLRSNSKTIKQKNKNKKIDKTYTPIEYKIEDYTLLVGKNNIQNDYLTLKVAKSNDIWFHTKDIHGSHAILQTLGQTPPIEVIIKCAQIAAYYSKARQSSNVPVDYTLAKYVKKPSGAKPGFVIYTHNQTINVLPNTVNN